jgi:hypothetical protein
MTKFKQIHVVATISSIKLKDFALQQNTAGSRADRAVRG